MPFAVFLDHTYGTGLGYYMYIETSFPQQPGDKARLISPEYNVSPGGSCLQFYYHMWGESTGALNVFLQLSMGIQGSPLWALSQDQGDLWRPARASIITSNKFRVEMRRKLSALIYTTLFFSRSSSKVLSVQVLQAIFRSMMFPFPRANAQLLVRAISNRTCVLGHPRPARMTSIGIVYHRNRSVFSTTVQITRARIQRSIVPSDTFSGLHRTSATTESINRPISSRKFSLLININQVSA